MKTITVRVVPRTQIRKKYRARFENIYSSYDAASHRQAVILVLGEIWADICRKTCRSSSEKNNSEGATELKRLTQTNGTAGTFQSANKMGPDFRPLRTPTCPLICREFTLLLRFRD